MMVKFENQELLVETYAEHFLLNLLLLSFATDELWGGACLSGASLRLTGQEVTPVSPLG
jgi:hypothetical protein